MAHPLYLVEQGSKVARVGEQLVITKEGEEIARVATLQVSQVLLFGNIQVTTPALQHLAQRGLEVVFLTQEGRFYGRLTGEMSGNSPLRVAQVLAAQDKAGALTVARACVRGKLHNMKVFLQRYARRRESDVIAAAAAKIDAQLAAIPNAPTTAVLSGLEGQATAVYFSAWPELLKAPWVFEKRVRRPPTDPVNVLLSFGYTLLQQNVMGAVLTAGLDPYVGFLHQLEYNRPSLTLDLMEEFRPLATDSTVLRCLNNDILLPAHFEPGDAERPIRLTTDGVRLFVREFEARLTQRFQHLTTGEQVNLRRLFLLQAYALARQLKGEAGASGYEAYLTR